MKVLVIGASGAIGRAVTAEMLARGHTVTAATRSGAPVEGVVVQAVTGDASDPGSVARLAAGQDAVASATGPRRANGEDPEDNVLGAARGLAEGLRRAGVRRLVVAGGAGSLEVAPGHRLVDTPDFSPAAKPRPWPTPAPWTRCTAASRIWTGPISARLGRSARGSGPGSSGSAATSFWSMTPGRAGSASPTSRSRSLTSWSSARRSAAGSRSRTDPAREEESRRWRTVASWCRPESTSRGPGEARR
jgi:hypothetical protein